MNSVIDISKDICHIYESIIHFFLVGNTFSPNCMYWRQTGLCDPYGPRESHRDKQCHEIVPRGASGYCECAHGVKKMMKRCEDMPLYANCNDVCNRKTVKTFLGN